MIVERQVTLYPHRDDNNWWTIQKVVDANVNETAETTETNEIEYIKHGDVITLLHTSSLNKRLHSHDVRAPMTELEYHNEVR